MYKYLIFSALCLAFLSCKNEEEQAQAADPVVKNVRSTGFDKQFSEMLNAYKVVQEKLIDWDSTGAAMAAAPLLASVKKLDLTEVEGEPSKKEILNKINYSLQAELEAFPKEANITDMRRSFFSISEMVYNLADQSKYSAQKVYKVSCPMAFNDNEEAHWVSLIAEVKNPYLGTKHPRYKSGMLECGEVSDSTLSSKP